MILMAAARILKNPDTPMPPPSLFLPHHDETTNEDPDV